MKAVIFDFNGTLFYDTPLHIEAWKEYVKDTLHRELSDEEFMERIWGRDNNAIIRDMYDCDDLNEIHRISEEKEKKYRDICETLNISLVDGATAFFDELKRRNIPFTIATGANKSNVDFYFNVFHLDKWFDYDKVIYDDGYLPGKPDPTIYIKAAQKINVKSEDCLVIEDSLVGVTSAKRAGVKEIAVVVQENEFNEDVTYRIHDFYELMEQLWKQNV